MKNGSALSGSDPLLFPYSVFFIPPRLYSSSSTVRSRFCVTSVIGYLYRIWLRIRFRLHRRRHDSLALETIEGIPILVLPAVFNPALFLTAELFIRTIRSEPDYNGLTVLDMGTGSGILAVTAALRGARTTACDINPEAIRAAEINARLNNVTIDTRVGDLFAPVSGEKFDRIIFSPPLFEGDPAPGIRQAFYGHAIAERFCASLANFLAPGGYALVLASSRGNRAALDAAAGKFGLAVAVAATDRIPGESFYILRLSVVVG
jgi:release factor glutamine methyltransferase